MAVCLPTVVAEFTKLTARLGLINCRALLPGNDQAVRCQRPLEMFFPFDPYLLRRSACFLDLRRTFLR
jgi:RNA polymerase I-specific transcription initiation factor RRN3